ncbi:HopJ type III effector protein [Halopseudomonas xinjiangensis]|uniref:HopJ type III effector protein n=1 Tax=Halopseudomonas xinjiangensis TaxID=487184 RepID=A0A1H1VSJ8_9GAMM|nr:HopJ type III effector protein [Halopseudomonas xinjiangensis]SDS87938.1 HopJ type III effector protein [Halopseudomonas xinjiangensis]
MTPEGFTQRLVAPEHRFAETLAFIDEQYVYRPSAFDNGSLHNSETENQGSCKVLAMAIDLGLTDEQTLQCFAEHYQAVLADPDGVAHGNIRALMRTGLAGVRFQTFPLSRR